MIGDVTTPSHAYKSESLGCALFMGLYRKPFHASRDVRQAQPPENRTGECTLEESVYGIWRWAKPVGISSYEWSELIIKRDYLLYNWLPCATHYRKMINNSMTHLDTHTKYRNDHRRITFGSSFFKLALVTFPSIISSVRAFAVPGAFDIP